ncbi:MAG: hypothetical protein ACLT3Y_03605 [Ruminococcus callidus]
MRDIWCYTENLVNGYVPYGNGGTQYQAHLVSKVVQGAGDLIYENDSRKKLSAAKSFAEQAAAGCCQQWYWSEGKLEHKHVAGRRVLHRLERPDLVGLTEDFVSAYGSATSNVQN